MFCNKCGYVNFIESLATNLLDIIFSFGYLFNFYYKNFPKNFLFPYAPLGTPLDFIIIYCHFKNTLNKATY
jgi:hypothetical protein